MADRKRLRWLLGASALLIGAGLLTWLDRGPGREQAEIDFPDQMRRHEEDRLRARQRLLTLLTGLAGDRRVTEVEEDPFMVALNGAAARGSVMVFELEALTESPVGQLIVNCFKQRDADRLEELKERTGFDPFETLDRAAVTEDLAILEGEFEGVDFSEHLEGRELTAYGPDAQLVAPSPDDAEQKWVGIWGNSMLLYADDREALVEALDLLKGDVPYDPEVLPSTLAYGEIYGSFDVDDAAGLFGDLDDEVGGKIADAAESVEFHLDASEDVAMVADVAGADPDVLNDLAKSLGGALSLARMTARSEGEDDLAELLDYASVDPGDEGFEMKLALPYDFLEDKLGDCSWLPERDPDDPDLPAGSPEPPAEAAERDEATPAGP